MDLGAGPQTNLKAEHPVPQQVIAQLDRILASPPFRTSKRCSDLLRHVVRAASEGRLDFLKERTLGIAVFERDPDYDTNQDPVVRNTAGQVRKRLAQYYCEPGRDRELRIDLPPGAYVPQMYQPVSQPEISPPVLAPAPALPVNHVRARVPIVVAALILASCALTFVLTKAFTRGVGSNVQTETAGVRLFWAPMMNQPGSVVLCVGQGHTYKLKGDLDRFFEAEPETSDRQAAWPRNIPFSDLVPIWDRSIGINDAQTLVRLSALFGRFGKAVEFRGGRSTSLADLRGRASVLIGAFNNAWTLSLTGELRFYFDESNPTPGHPARIYLVRDRLHPRNRDWEVRADQQPSEDYIDYAIVSRVFNPTTEKPVIVAAGIKGGGTAAAGEFLTSGAYLEQALQNAPPHWEKRNVQFVLKTRLLGGTAGPPQLVVAHYW